MKHKKRLMIPLLMMVLLLFAAAAPSEAEVFVQCPDDTNGNGIPPTDLFGNVLDPGDVDDPSVKCMHITGGDGFIKMADGEELYIFSYADVTGIGDENNDGDSSDDVIDAGTLAHTFPAPKIVVDEGDELYLNLTNVGMAIRPDLFDPHTVHWHGFPEAAPVFDGVPDSSVSINMLSTLTYYYNVVEPGTFMYHCHVEATEHMQMGMLGNLYVRPAQNGDSIGGYTQFVYNDTDGSTGYDVEAAIQLSSFDGDFHTASEIVQPLPFALMRDNYPMMNGRGYPDTIKGDNDIPAPAGAEPIGTTTNPESSLVTATVGDRILLRLSNLSVTRFFTLRALGLPMQVVGKDAKLLRGPEGSELYHNTGTLTIGPGETFDVLVDTATVAAGTYFLHATDLNYLSNNEEALGGLMTEIVIN